MSTFHLLAEIGDERIRQILFEGYDHQHDDAHDDFELARAASVLTTYACLPETDRCVATRHGPRLYGAELLWPWDLEHFKLANPRRDLIKAAALIVAEIERMDRAAIPSTVTSDLIRGKPSTPAVMIDDEHYERPAHGWTCFHCGETFHTIGSARQHFGFDPQCDPACRIKLGAERSLLSAYRALERENERLQIELHNESIEGMKAFRDLQSRVKQITRHAEELGYERGLADARGEPTA